MYSQTYTCILVGTYAESCRMAERCSRGTYALVQATGLAQDLYKEIDPLAGELSA